MAGREGGRIEKEKEKRQGGDSPKHTQKLLESNEFFLKTGFIILCQSSPRIPPW